MRSKKSSKNELDFGQNALLSMVFGQNLKILTSVKKAIPGNRASREEQTGANFSFIAPSSEELCMQKTQMHGYGKGRHTYMYKSNVQRIKLQLLITPHSKVLRD